MAKLPQDCNCQEKLNKRTVAFYFVVYLLIITSVFSILAYFHMLNERRNIIDEYKIKIKSRLKYQAEHIQEHFNSVKSDILFLPQLNEIIAYKQLNNEKDRALIEREFLEFTLSKKVYDQIRYINANGQEICRINNNNGFPSVVPKDKLQNKSDRYYFKKSLQTRNGEVYISPFDLNIENGKIERPFKPMIRFGTPVIGDDGKPKGVIILNYLGQIILNDLKKSEDKECGTYSLLNQNGYWFSSWNPDDEWGFMFKNRLNFTMANRKPKLWQKISSNKFYQEHINGALYTSLIITPFSELNNNEIKRNWILLSTISDAEMGIKWMQFDRTLESLLAYFLILIIAVSYLLAKGKVQKQSCQNALTMAALYDSLTGLPNRKLLMDRLEHTLEESKRYDYRVAVLFIDLDGFKSVNDTMGHKAGDMLLKMVAERLINLVRKSDTVARFGGDEFIVLLSHIDDDENCFIIAEKICSMIARPFIIFDKEVVIGASIGVTICTGTENCNADSLIQKSDRAMYEAKKSGKGIFKKSDENC